MPKPIIWTAQQDATILQQRAAGFSWDHIAGLVGVARWTAIERGNAIGAVMPERSGIYMDKDRAPLASGSAATWGAINDGTCLEGAEYPPLVTVRVPVETVLAMREAA